MPDLSVQSNAGGQYNFAMTANTTAETAIYTGAGRVCKLFVTAAGTASLSIYDGTQSTGGTLIFTTLTNDALGTIKEVQCPVTTGIVLKGTTGSPGVCISYAKAGQNGN